MKPNDLQAAFSMIGKFKRGQITPGAEVSDDQIEMIQLLCEDLLPAEVFSVENLDDMLKKISRADTEWNHKTQAAIDEFYSLSEAGKDKEAQQRRIGFLNQCPSSWYRSIVEAL